MAQQILLLYDFAETGAAKDKKCNVNVPESVNRERQHLRILFVFENNTLCIF